MSANVGGLGGPISQRPVPEGVGPTGSPGGGAPTGEPPAPPTRVLDPRLEMLRDKLKQYGPYVAYSAFFLVALLLFAYWTFPYERVRDRIVADFEKQQRVPPGGARQSLSIGKLEPSWLTGVVLKDVSLTSTPQDPTKPSSILHADEIKLRVSFGTMLSENKDVTFSAAALGGTLSGSVTHVKTVNPTPAKAADKDKDTGPKFDRVVKMELADLALNELAPLRDAVGAGLSGTLRGTIDLTLGESRLDKANGTIALEIENFGLPGENDAEAVEACKAPSAPKPCETRRVHFKVPALKAFFGKDEIALPPIAIGNMPIQVTIKNGVARVEKMSAGGKDLEVNLDGQVMLRELLADSDANLGLRFKFNDSYKKKNPAAEGVLLLLDNEPKLKAGKRPDGFYGLRLVGLLGGSLQVLPNAGGPGSMGAMGAGGPRPAFPMSPPPINP